MLLRLLKELGITGAAYETGEEALEAIKSQAPDEEFSVFIVDVNLPGMGGKAFIQYLHELIPNAIILVATGNARTEDIIDIMKNGVYDYFVKPLDLVAFESVLRSALSYAGRVKTESEFVNKSSEKLREKLEWLSYKESRSRMGDDSSNKATIYNLKTSLSQGGGFGALITLIDMLQVTEERADGKSVVDSAVLDLLYENSAMARQSVEGLSKLEDLMSREVQIEAVDGRFLHDQMQNFFEDLVPEMERKTLRLSYPTLRHYNSVSLNIELFRVAIRELVVNAIKFAKQGSEIGIFSGITDGYFVIGVKNDVDEAVSGGIPDGAEQLVIEPFFRAHPPVEGFKEVEQFSLGLGLTAVDMIMSKHHGLFFIGNAMDHTSEKPGKCVMARMLFPIVREE